VPEVQVDVLYFLVLFFVLFFSIILNSTKWIHLLFLGLLSVYELLSEHNKLYTLFIFHFIPDWEFLVRLCFVSTIILVNWEAVRLLFLVRNIYDQWLHRNLRIIRDRKKTLLSLFKLICIFLLLKYVHCSRIENIPSFF